MHSRLVLPPALSFLALLALTQPACEKAEPPAKAPEPVHVFDPTPPKPAVVDPTPVKYRHTGASYDDALAVPEDLDAVQSAPELSNAELSEPLSNPTFLTSCGATDSMVVMIKVAIRNGKAMGVTVATRPASPEVAACVDKAVRQLSWPPSAKRFSLTTRY